ncbi:MAG TPA: NB-ARC domain-containing protein, partial [Streptosporangiaceae bacterium]|nr:NB-ARC domain-containing protein [Streptosporangiaceae bacterium]
MSTQHMTMVRELSLPFEITTFVGRQRELSALEALVDAERLVTVTGPGGVGKTRLALRAAAEAAEGFADGVCLVELSGLHDAELLTATIGTALGLFNAGLSESGSHNRLDEVTDFLRNRDLLLVLDTCEHLVDACAMFADVLLRSTASVTVLATSRQPLDVPGEHVFTVAPLGTSDAVELFAQRAATVTGGFQVTPENRACVEMLCERLDGVPLALELATVRL